MSATSHSQEFAQHEIDRLQEELRKKTAELVATREEGRQKMQEFAREFRVPLATVLGFSDILSARDRTHTTEWNRSRSPATSSWSSSRILSGSRCRIRRKTVIPQRADQQQHRRRC